MSAGLLVLFIVLFLGLIYHEVRSKNLFRDPIGIMIIWWTFWAMFSTFGVGGLYSISNLTAYLIAIFLVSLMLGSWLDSKWCPGLLFPEGQSEFYVPNVWGKLILAYVFVLTIITLWLSGIYLERAIFTFLNSVDSSHLRGAFFASADGPGLVYDSIGVQTVFLIASGIIVNLVLVVGIGVWVKHRNWQGLALALFMAGVDCIVKVSRTWVYSVILLLIVAEAISIGRKYKDILSNILGKVGFATLFVVGAAFLFVMGQVRGSSGLLDQVESYLVNYHTVGFSLMSFMLSGKTPVNVEDPQWGRMSLGGLELPVTIVSRQIVKGFTSPAYQNSDIINQRVCPGVTEFLLCKPYNAYYTMLSSPYLDFREFGIIVFGVLFGFLLSWSHRCYQQSGSLAYLSFLLFLLLQGLLGIFGATLESVACWQAFLLLIAYMCFEPGWMRALRKK